MDVKLPDGRVLRGIPDGTTKAELAQKLASNGIHIPGVSAPSLEDQSYGGTGGGNPMLSMLGSGALKAGESLGMTPENTSNPIANAAGPGEAALNYATGGAAMIPAGLAGLGQGLKNLVSPGMPAADRVRQVESALTYQPRTGAGQGMATVAGAPLQALGTGTNYLGEKTTDITGSPALGALVKTAGDFAPSLIGARVMPKRVGARPLEDYVPKNSDVPTKAELKQAATSSYKHSENIGAVVSEDSFGAFQNELADQMQKQGIDPTLHPDATAALKRITAERGPMTLEKIETLRRIAQDAEGSIKPADAKKAGDMVDSIDSMVENLKPEDLSSGTAEAATALKQARNYWSRARKADIVDELMRRAELSAPNFSASGMENAIRTEFRGLAKNERRFKRFTPEEQAAITQVVKGGKLDNVFRMIGKAAPTGVVSTGLGTGLGFMLGGPAGAALVPALGATARLMARGATGRNAAVVNELVRRGPQAQDILNARSPAGIGNPTRSAIPAAGPVPAVETLPSQGNSSRAKNPTGGGATSQAPGRTSGASQSADKKTLEQLYLEALIDEMRGRR